MDEEQQLAELIQTSDQSVYLFVKDGRVTMVLGQEPDIEFLVDMLGYVVASLLTTIDKTPSTMVH